MKEMSFLDHLQELRDRLIWSIATLGVISIFTFTFGVSWIQPIDGFIPIPYPNPTIHDSISVNFFRTVQQSVLPSDVRPVVTGPTDALMASLLSSLFLGLAISMPMLVYQGGKFLAPGLKSEERRTIIWIAGPAAILFIFGSLFAYYIILPIWFRILYAWAGGLGATKFVNVRILFSFIFKALLAFGLIFELPIIQFGVTRLGVVSADFWKDYWRWAVVIIVFVSALITPADVITLVMVAAPMTCLYFLGYYVAKIGRGKRELGFVDRLKRKLGLG